MEPDESLRDKLRHRYLERYKRIKDERKTILNTLIGLSGGCVVLSITFLEKIAPYKRLLPLIIVAWCLLGLAILVSVYGLIKMIYNSQRFQRKLERALNDPDLKVNDPITREMASESKRAMYYQVPEYLSGSFFAAGVIALAFFAIVNLLTSR